MGFVFLLKLAIKKAIFADDLLATESVLAFNYSPLHIVHSLIAKENG